MPTEVIETPSRSAKAEKYAYRNRSWTNTPNFKQLAKADLPVNPYSDEKYDSRQTFFSGAWSTNQSTGGVTYDAVPQWLYSGFDIRDKHDNAQNAAGFDAMANRTYDETMVALLVKAADMKANLAVMYAEAEKTSKHILTTATRVADAYRALRKGNFGEVAKQLGIRDSKTVYKRWRKGKRVKYEAFTRDESIVHKTWLEYKYGWMPLLMDVKQSAEFFAQQTLGGRPVHFVVEKKGRGRVEYDHSSTYAPAYGGVGSGTWRDQFVGDYECHIKLWLEVTNPALNQLQQLGVLNPALVAWEVVPYSFVIDWFLSVGDWLTAQTALTGLTIRKSLRSNVNITSYQYTQPSTVMSSSGYWYTNSARSCNLDKRWYARGSVDNLNTLLLSIPRQAPGRPFEKLVTGLALLKSNSRTNRALNRL